MPLDVKICGLSDEGGVDAAVAGGARFTGFVFFDASPRNVTPARAAELAKRVPAGVATVGLVVDADDNRLAEIAAAGLNMLQLHGSETPERTREIRERFTLPVIKVIAVAGAADVAGAGEYGDAADFLMFDAKPAADATRPGGNARAFEWALLRGLRSPLPWLLAGGLTAENLVEAVHASGAGAVDVSSGVEDAPGAKSAAKIKAFLAAAANL